MNWIYVDRSTYELKFGPRPSAQPNLPGPFDCSRQDRRLTFAGWEGFFAVQESGFWALYFDVDQDMLKSKIKSGTPVLEVQVVRVEMRVQPVKAEKPSGEDSKDNAAQHSTSESDSRHQEQDLETRIETSEGQDLESPDVD